MYLQIGNLQRGEGSTQRECRGQGARQLSSRETSAAHTQAGSEWCFLFCDICIQCYGGTYGAHSGIYAVVLAHLMQAKHHHPLSDDALLASSCASVSSQSETAECSSWVTHGPVWQNRQKLMKLMAAGMTVTCYSNGMKQVHTTDRPPTLIQLLPEPLQTRRGNNHCPN